jgi:hypothetical protein
LKSLLVQFGSKAKAVDELDNDAKKIRNNIEALMAKAQSRVNKVGHVIINVSIFHMEILNDQIFYM